MKLSYLVFNVSKAALKTDGTLNFTPGTVYNATFYKDREGAASGAAVCARSGNIGIVYEAKEFHQVEPAPVEVRKISISEQS